MSFRAAYTDVVICNRALSLLKESPISAMDAGGVAARECRTHYSPLVRWLLEEHDWGFGAVRNPLAALLTNDRTVEWLYAYAAPDDLAYIVDVIPFGNGTQIGYYQGLKQFDKRQRFLRVGRTIYSNVAGAYLDYVSLDISEDIFTEQFINVIVLYMASRMAVGLRGSEKMRDAYDAKGLTALQNAKAKNLNEQRQTYGDQMSDADRVRAGGSEYFGGIPYPGANFYRWPS